MAEKAQSPAAPQMSYAPGGTPQPDGVFVHQNGGYDGVARAPQQSFSNKWSNSFFDCFSPMETCFMGWCCPCFLFGKTQARLKDPSLSSFSYLNGMCCGWYCLAAIGGCHCILQGIKRGDMRDRFGIEGNSFGDWCGAWCCACCGLVQEEKEALLRTQGGQGYQKTAGMTY